MKTLGGIGIADLARERRDRVQLYGSSRYWDARAARRDGLARSLWPSNVFNDVWDERQRQLLRRNLGSLRGRAVVDVGCGTGRMARYAASRGATRVVGIDFSPSTVLAADAEERSSGVVRFVVGDVVRGLDHVGARAFDDALVLGCLSVACSDPAELGTALANVARLVRHGGRVTLLEPIHEHPLLRRVLGLGVDAWIELAEAAGLRHVRTDRMGFVPARLGLSVRDLPRPLTHALFWGGERLLDAAPFLSPLADYTLLVFRA